MEKVTGIAKDRLLPTFAKVRFSKWFRGSRRSGDRRRTPRATVALFPTCLVEYQDPAIGKAIVGVYEHNGIACELPEGQVCCGMPWLDAGDVDKFREARGAQRGRARAAGARRARRRRAAAHVRVRAEERVPRLPRHRRRAARRRAHLRHVGVPAWRATARSRSTPSSPAPRTTRSLWHAACHYRAQQIGPEEQAADGAHRRQGHDGRAVLGHRRHLGAAGREHRDGEAGGQAADGRRCASPTTDSSPATATSRTPRSRRTRPRRRRTRCR